ncbi:hypothetical protein NBRC116495_30310 [Aurantivibrio plasticivorans]
MTKGLRMAKLHLIGGEKGGVGKSFTARLLAQYYIDHGKPFVGFDSDQSHQTFSRFYDGYTSPVFVDQYESLDQIIDAAELGKSDILVDLAAQTLDDLSQWMKESGILDLLQSIGFEVYYWHVADGGYDSITLLTKALNQFKHKNLTTVIVQNAGRGEHFSVLQNSSYFKNAIQDGAKTLTLEKLHPLLASKIDFSSLSFWAAANSSDRLTRVEKHRVKVWMEKNYTQLNELLSFSPEIEEAPVV